MMFAGRAAPVQVTWLGFWGTTGLSSMDYILSDEDTIPPGQERLYSERVLRLPGSRFCYEAPDYAPEPVAPPCLAGGGVTFGSFNDLTKVGPEVIGLWARVLQAVPLPLGYCSNGSPWPMRVRAATTDEATFADGGRSGWNDLILRGPSPHEVMLKEYRGYRHCPRPIPLLRRPDELRSALDGCCLWSRCRAPRRRHDRRWGFLRAIERTEWVASSPEDYVRIAASAWPPTKDTACQ